MNRICTICARGGSKGVKNKNIRDLKGKPLIVHSILQARASGLFDFIAVSSDSDLILSVAKQAGVDYIIKRPDELASDQAAKIPVIQHCVLEAERLCGNKFDTIVDLDATSPLRNVDDIKNVVAMLEDENRPNIITGMPARRSPYFNLVEMDAQGVVKLSKELLVPIVRRQDSPKCYDMNASIYAWQRINLFKSTSLFNKDTTLYIMPEERSVDIDSELDFKFVELLMSQREN